MTDTSATPIVIATRQPDTYAFAPILSLAATILEKEQPTDKDISKLSGMQKGRKVSERRVGKARAEGYVDAYVADKLAYAVGKHPNTIWADWDTSAHAMFAGDLKEKSITLPEAIKKMTGRG